MEVIKEGSIFILTYDSGLKRVHLKFFDLDKACKEAGFAYIKLADNEAEA